MSSEKSPDVSKRRVVVTGIGVISPVGNDVKSTWQSIIAGDSGLGYISRFSADDYDYPIAAEVKNFHPAEFIDPKLERRIDLSTSFAMVAARQAWYDAGLEQDDVNMNRAGIIIGTGIGGGHLMIEAQRVLDEKGPRRVSPFLITNMLADTASGLIAIDLGLKGPNFAVTAACATGGAATGEAISVIQRGEADIVLAGGHEAPLQPVFYAGFNAMKALATSDDPVKAVKPFDSERNGFILGEGAAVLVLEESERALARGAHIYAECKAAATSSDAFDMVAADGTGIANAMTQALKQAEISPQDIDYINAHGTGTLLNDKVETKAIKSVFGESAYKLAVSSTKAATGHLMGAAGAVEAALTVLAIENNILPPTLNYGNPDPECDLDYVPNSARPREIRNAISTSVGLGGHNSAIVFSQWAG
jgi:3-oxoacyl-[acyl-carrier-protein] synthase II